VAIIDVVKWDGQGYGKQADDALLAWKFPSTELSTWTQLIVNESQEAVLFRAGSMDGPFGPGRHVLKTENLPVIGALLKLPFGRSPFTAEVWYTNRAIPLDVLWGTPEAIRLKDPVYNIIIPVVAHGQYAVQIEHSRKFIVKLVGTMREFDREKMRSYLRGMILTVAKTTIAREIVKRNISILEIATQLIELSDAIQADLLPRLDEFGLKLVNFFVTSIDVKEDDQSIETLRKALAKRAEMGIVGFTYQQERSLNALEGAAGFTAADNGIQANPNSMTGLGVGLGVAVPLGQAVGQQFSSLVAPTLQGGRQLGTQGAPPAGMENCTKCDAPRANPTAKFCLSCGAPFAVDAPPPCHKCGSPLVPGAKFCADCGAPASEPCRNCGKELGPSAKFCTDCGTPRASEASRSS